MRWSINEFDDVVILTRTDWTNDNDIKEKRSTHKPYRSNEMKKSDKYFTIARYLCKMLIHVDRVPSTAIPISCRSFGHLCRLCLYHLNEMLDFPLYSRWFFSACYCQQPTERLLFFFITKHKRRFGYVDLSTNVNFHLVMLATMNWRITKIFLY